MKTIKLTKSMNISERFQIDLDFGVCQFIIKFVNIFYRQFILVNFIIVNLFIVNLLSSISLK